MTNAIQREADFLLDIDDERLWRDNHPVPLTPKAFALLRYLVTHRNRLLTKQTLLNAVWPDTYVVESKVKHYIHALRTALDDEAKTSRFIETVRGRGYRFIGEIKVRRLGAAPGQDNRAVTLHPKAKVGILPQSGMVSGRATELAQLQQWLDTALAGERIIGFVTGELGIGKTTLVSVFLETLSARDDLWIVRGQCTKHHSAGEAYLPVLEALEQLCQGTDGDRVIACLVQQAPSWLLQMPNLLDLVEPDDLQHRTQGACQARMLRELTQTLEVLSAEQGLILWLEDLHCADVATLELIVHLTYRTQNARLLLLGTYRPEETQGNDPLLATMTTELQMHNHCEELPLKPLSESAVGDYLTQQLPGSVAKLAPVIYPVTGGNPLFLENFLKDLIAREVIAQTGEHWVLRSELQHLVLEIPHSLRRLIESRLDQLSVEDQRLLEIASVAGLTFSAAVVAACLAQPIESVEESCEALVQRQQFLARAGTSEWPDGTVAARYEFPYAVYQQVLYDRVTPARRDTIHRMIGERLECGYGERKCEITTRPVRHFDVEPGSRP